MTKKLPRNVSAFFDRHGHERLRFRKAGYPTAYFTSEIGTPEFDEQLDRFLSGEFTLSKRSRLDVLNSRISRKQNGLSRAGSVYFVGGDEGLIKIGTSQNLEQRLCDLQVGSPIKLRILASAPGGRRRELIYHRRFASAWRHGEWHERHPDILAEIARINAIFG